jgi:hypothetical protein
MSAVDITLQQFLIGAVVAFLVGVLVRLGKKLEDRYWEWRYPIATEYLSWFDSYDSTDSNPSRSTLRWYQFGRSLRGKDNLTDGSAQWTQDAEIRNGTIVGRYSSDNPHEDDAGIYFLRIERDGRLAGYWAGQDAHEATELRTGRFELVPRRQNMRTTPVTDETLPAALVIDDWRRSVSDPVDILQQAAASQPTPSEDDSVRFVSALGYQERSRTQLLRRLGERVFDVKPLGRWRTENREALQQRAYTGLIVASIGSASAVADRLGTERSSLPDPITQAGRVGLVELIALTADTHSRAVALELCRRVIKRCQSDGATVVVLPVDSEDEILKDIIARLEFESVGSVQSAGSTVPDEVRQPSQLVGDGGENTETTLYIWFD